MGRVHFAIHFLSSSAQLCSTPFRPVNDLYKRTPPVFMALFSVALGKSPECCKCVYSIAYFMTLESLKRAVNMETLDADGNRESAEEKPGIARIENHIEIGQFLDDKEQMKSGNSYASETTMKRIEERVKNLDSLFGDATPAPVLSYGVKGLYPDIPYTITIFLQRKCGNFMKYEDGAWKETSKPVDGPEYTNCYTVGTKRGREWMAAGINAEHLKIYNIGNPKKIGGKPVDPNDRLAAVRAAEKAQKLRETLARSIEIKSLTKYLPILTIWQILPDGKLREVQWFSAAETQFFTCTGYKNPLVRTMKSNDNKYVIRPTSALPVGSDNPAQMVPLADFLALKESFDTLSSQFGALIQLLKGILPDSSLHNLSLPSNPLAGSSLPPTLPAPSSTKFCSTLPASLSIAKEAASLLDKSTRAVIERLPDDPKNPSQDSVDMAAVSSWCAKFDAPQPSSVFRHSCSALMRPLKPQFANSKERDNFTRIFNSKIKPAEFSSSDRKPRARRDLTLAELAVLRESRKTIYDENKKAKSSILILCADILLLTETFLNDSVPSSLFSSNSFSMLRFDRDPSAHSKSSGRPSNLDAPSPVVTAAPFQMDGQVMAASTSDVVRWDPDSPTNSSGYSSDCTSYSPEFVPAPSTHHYVPTPASRQYVPTPAPHHYVPTPTPYHPIPYPPAQPDLYYSHVPFESFPEDQTHMLFQ
ncbi:unnamed protein product [Caenorhabditis sp. 36 PRJEB53466]|nr:unnamed protein product [Caenorhabditis sp. 36 PRJEB53466]